MSKIPNAAAYTDADAALDQAIAYEENAKIYLAQDDFTAAAHAGRLRDSFFDRAVELTNA